MSFRETLRRHRELFEQMGELEAVAGDLASDLVRALNAGGKVLFFGNGGSAADSQHLAAEFVVRFVAPRRPLPALALTVDSSVLTAQANDYDFASVFSRQVAALASPMDIVIGITTSGSSGNVIQGLEEARRIGARSWGWTGGNGAGLAAHCDRVLVIPSSETARIQEAHLFVGHWLCEEMDRIFASR